MLPVFYALGAGVYQVYYALLRAARPRSARAGSPSSSGCLFITEVMLILVFGVDYRYVEAVLYRADLAHRLDDFPLRMLVPCVVVAADVRRAAALPVAHFHRARDPAVAQDPLALQLMAASPTRIKRIAFGISIATASIAGALLIIIQPVEPSVGREYIGRVFAICVLGGLGSLPGTLIAAMLLGIWRASHRPSTGRPGRRRSRSACCCSRWPSGRRVSSDDRIGDRADPAISCGGDRGGAAGVFRRTADRATTTCSSPATPCCNSSCWRRPGTSSAAIPDT